jgi:elongation factor G
MAKSDKDKLDLKVIRNLGIIAHIDAGKTTTTEHVLYYAGETHKLGGVDEGTTITDWMQLEQEKGITIQSACIPLHWEDPLDRKKYRINLIDTPGHVDFTAEVERSLRVLDGCVVVFDAQKGVEAQSETVWRQANKYQVPRLIFINKMDVVGAGFAAALAQIKERLQCRPLPLTIPMGSGSPKDSVTPFRAVVDLLTMELCEFLPSHPERNDGKVVKRTPLQDPEVLHAYLEENNLGHYDTFELWDATRQYRDQLFDVLTESDEDDRITSRVLEGQAPALGDVIHLIRQRTLRGDIQPVFCGSGREHIGIQLLMNGVCWYLPSPLDRPPVTGKHPKKDKQESRKPDPAEPFAALVFKIQSDPHGELYYLRIYSGTVKANSRPWNPGKETKEFVTKLYHVHADPHHKDSLETASAGDIVATVGPKESITGDTLCDPQHPILLETIQFAETVVSMSIEPETSADKQKLEDTLTLLAREDPTFRWHVDRETGQTLISGMGVLHLEIKIYRLRDDFRLKVRVGKPLVSYRETLARPIRTEGECVRQAGAAGLFGRVTVEFERFRGEQPITVVNRLDAEKVPAEFAAAAEQGIRGAFSSGMLGFPVMAVKATLVDAEVDQQLSNETAFTAAGADAVHKALRDNIVLLEPIMHLEVTVPEEYLGAVTADLNARRAEIKDLLTRGNLRIIEAEVPLARMFDYADKVRSLSQGRASSTMEPAAYREAPPEVLHALLHPEDIY